jgi:hypothetical protein
VKVSRSVVPRLTEYFQRRAGLLTSARGKDAKLAVWIHDVRVVSLSYLRAFTNGLNSTAVNVVRLCSAITVRPRE